MPLERSGIPAFVVRSAALLISTEVWVAGLVAAAALLSDRWLMPGLVLLALFWPLRLLATGRLSLPTGIDWPVFCLLLMLPVSLWITPQPDITWVQSLRLLLGVGLAYAVVNWTTTQGRLSLVLIGLFLAGAILALVAPVAVQWPSSSKFPAIPAVLYDRFALLSSDTINPNVMGGTLAFLLPLPLALLLFAWTRLTWSERALYLLVILVMVPVLGLTQSRGAISALGLAVLLLIGLRMRPTHLGLGLFVVGVAVAGVIGVNNWGVRWIGSGGSNIQGRAEIWGRGLKLIRDYPWTGIGMGNFGYAADILYPVSALETGWTFHVHNVFLQVALDLGIPGLVAWTAILLVVSMASLGCYREGHRRQDPLMAGLGAGLLASQVVFVTHGLTDATLWGMTRPALLVWVVWGVALAAQHVGVRHSLPAQKIH